MTFVRPNPTIVLTPLTVVGGGRVIQADVVEPSLATPTARPRRDRRAVMLERRPVNETAIARLRSHLYAHGAYLGMTRSFLQNANWNHLLHVLTPQTGARVNALLQANDDMEGDNLTALMTLVENNPVLAAYGTWRNKNASLPIEWDIWLDPKDPSNIDGARIIHGNGVAEHFAKTDAPEAADLTQQSRLGSDVHTGFSPRAWRQAYDSALGSVRSPSAPRRRLPLYLDVKSSYSSPADINAFARAVQRALKVEVRGVMSFKLTQLDTISARHKVFLFDTPEEVAAAQAAGALPHGAIAMFNGGFLLRAESDVAADTWSIDPVRFGLLQAAQLAGNLRLTIYIQETVASPSALNTLFRFLNTAPRADNPRRRMFTLGPAYGNVNGRAERSRTGSGTTMQFASSFDDEGANA